MLELLVPVGHHDLGWPRPLSDVVAAASIGVAAATAAALVVFAWRANAVHASLVCSAVGPFVCAGMVSLWTPIWVGRYFRFAHLFLLLVVAGAVWRVLPSRGAMRSIAAAVLWMGMGMACLVFWREREIPARPGMGGAMNAIAARWQSGELIVTLSGIHRAPAAYYAKQLDRLNGIQVRTLTPDPRMRWGWALLNREDIIPQNEVVEALDAGVWWLDHGDEPGPAWLNGLDVHHTLVGTFRYDNGSPPWHVRLAYFAKAASGSQRIVAGPRQPPADSKLR